jgi:predicted DNA-binding ribbon-helix-helix protein
VKNSIILLIKSNTNSTLILRVASIAYLLHSNELMILYRASSNWNAYNTNSTLILRVASIAYLLHSNELMILYRASSNWNAYNPTIKTENLERIGK